MRKYLEKKQRNRKKRIPSGALLHRKNQKNGEYLVFLYSRNYIRKISCKKPYSWGSFSEHVARLLVQISFRYVFVCEVHVRVDQIKTRVCLFANVIDSIIEGKLEYETIFIWILQAIQ